jgi:nucleoside 2-deoxyribosyltransferase
MQIYFSCSITGGRDDQPVYRSLVQALLEDGHIVPTAHLADPDIPVMEKTVNAKDVFLRDSTWIKECDAVIAEVTTPSHGVGYEIALAEFTGKPIFLCYRKGARVSKMLLGNPSSLFVIYPYTSIDGAIKNMRVFLNRAVRE